MELIISILFFALASAVCIQLFVKAHLLGNETMEQNKAIMWCQNLAELFTECDGSLDEIYSLLLAGESLSEQNIVLFDTPESKGKSLCIFFTRDFTPCAEDSQNLAYTALLSSEETSSHFFTANVSFYCVTPEFSCRETAAFACPDCTLLYSLNLEHHKGFTLEEMEASHEQ